MKHPLRSSLHISSEISKDFVVLISQSQCLHNFFLSDVSKLVLTTGHFDTRLGTQMTSPPT